MPGEPAELSLEDAERLREKRAQKQRREARIRAIAQARVRALTLREVAGIRTIGRVIQLIHGRSGESNQTTKEIHINERNRN